MDDNGRYNGWKNYETWAVGMFLDGNYDGEHVYREVQHLLEAVHENAEADSRVIEGIWTLERARVFNAADALKDFTEREVTSEAYEGLRGDLIGAALSEVDWEELAENKLSALAES